MNEEIKKDDVPEILKALKAIEDDAIKQISEGKRKVADGKRMLAKVRKAQKEILLKHENEDCSNKTERG